MHGDFKDDSAVLNGKYLVMNAYVAQEDANELSSRVAQKPLELG